MRRLTSFSVVCLLAALSLSLSGCGPKSDGAPLIKTVFWVPDGKVKDEPLSRIGNKPYTVFGQRYYPMESAKGYKEVGTASWYGTKFHGRKTSNGETYDLYGMTAAHKTLPLPTYVKVTNLKNHRSVIVKVNDRGPFHGDRLLDLSYAAARKLGMDKHGTGKVRIEALDPKDHTGFQAVKKVVKRLMPHFSDYYVQVGAYQSKANADKALDRLTRHDSAKIVQERNLYRVLVGPYKTMQHAEKEKIKLVNRGLADAHVISE